MQRMPWKPSSRVAFQTCTLESDDPCGRARLYEPRRRMGMLFQFGTLFTDRSVFDNVVFLRGHQRK
jgi:ABC-type transporter Mla maintaining outer membrane lipid asymmetry ATPase subunit MlaF